MSKSRGNVVNPDELSAATGPTRALYLLFLGPMKRGRLFRQGHPRHHRFLARVGLGILTPPPARGIEGTGTVRVRSGIHAPRHRGAQEDIEALNSTRLAAIIITPTGWRGRGRTSRRKRTGRACAPSSCCWRAHPDITEELWERLGEPTPSTNSPGRSTRALPGGTDRDPGRTGRRQTARPHPGPCQATPGSATARPRQRKVARLLDGRKVVDAIYVPDRLVNP